MSRTCRSHALTLQIRRQVVCTFRLYCTWQKLGSVFPQTFSPSPPDLFFRFYALKYVYQRRFLYGCRIIEIAIWSRCLWMPLLVGDTTTEVVFSKIKSFEILRLIFPQQFSCCLSEVDFYCLHHEFLYLRHFCYRNQILIPNKWIKYDVLNNSDNILIAKSLSINQVNAGCFAVAYVRLGYTELLVWRAWVRSC